MEDIDTKSTDPEVESADTKNGEFICTLCAK